MVFRKKFQNQRIAGSGHFRNLEELAVFMKELVVRKVVFGFFRTMVLTKTSFVFRKNSPVYTRLVSGGNLQVGGLNAQTASSFDLLVLCIQLLE
jgi:hypothetical protein